MGLLGIPDPGKWRQQNVTTAVTDTERVMFFGKECHKHENNNDFSISQRNYSKFEHSFCCVEIPAHLSRIFFAHHASLKRELGRILTHRRYYILVSSFWLRC